jgi:hypothetical protein
VQKVWSVAGDDDETTFHWRPNVGCGKKPIPAFDKNGNTLRLVGGEGKRKNHRARSVGEIALPAAVQSWFRPQSNPQMPSGGGVRAKGSSPRQSLAVRSGDLAAPDAPPGTRRWFHGNAGPLVKCHGVVLASAPLCFIWGRTCVVCTRRPAKRVERIVRRTGDNGSVGRLIRPTALIMTPMNLKASGGNLVCRRGCEGRRPSRTRRYTAGERVTHLQAASHSHHATAQRTLDRSDRESGKEDSPHQGRPHEHGHACAGRIPIGG